MARTVGSSGERTHAEIRRVARKLIRQQGFDAMSVRQLADEVGIQSGALYRYIGSKQALLGDVMVTHIQSLLDEWLGVADNSPNDPIGALKYFAQFHIRYHAARVDDTFLFYREVRSLAPKDAETVRDIRRRYEECLKEIIQSGIDQGVFPKQDIKLTRMAIFGLLASVYTWFDEDGETSLDEVCAFCANWSVSMALTPQKIQSSHQLSA